MWKTLWDGIFPNNPVFRLALGLVPAVGVTTLAWNGLYLGGITTAVLVLAVLGTVLIGKAIPQGARPILHLALVALFTTLAQRILAINYPEVVVSLGIYLPLIVVNGVVLQKLEVNSKPGEAIVDALGMGVGFTVALVVIGMVREFLAVGQIFGAHIVSQTAAPFALAGTIPGGLIVLGLLLALVNALTGKGGEIIE